MKRIGMPLFVIVLLVGCGKLNPFGSGDSEAKPTSYWIEQLKNNDEDKRKEAMKVLVEFGKQHKTVIEDLIDALKNPNKQVRMGAAEVLGRLGSFHADEAAEPLAAMLRDPDEDIARAAAKALVRVDPKKAAESGVPRDIK